MSQINSSPGRTPKSSSAAEATRSDNKRYWRKLRVRINKLSDDLSASNLKDIVGQVDFMLPDLGLPQESNQKWVDINRENVEDVKSFLGNVSERCKSQKEGAQPPPVPNPELRKEIPGGGHSTSIVNRIDNSNTQTVSLSVNQTTILNELKEEMGKADPDKGMVFGLVKKLLSLFLA